ncbi:MAG: NAD-dependent epimerase, partial [Clostridia bacterium]|nr:NAD-dependent epimerase [Clostridia bacterium]
MKKILITGANSYIGTSFENYISNFEGYIVDTVDMIDGTWREKDFSDYDTVFHVAGLAHSDVGNV